MRMIQAQDLAFSYNSIDPVFSGVRFVVERGDKIGIVGDNGSGKSTLVKCLTGELTPSGTLYVEPGTSMSYLRQQITSGDERTVMETCLQKYQDIFDMEASMRRMEEDIAAAAEHPKRLESLLDAYQSLRDAFEKKNGYGYLSEIKGFLATVGLGADFYDRPTALLSGGEKARLDLALVFMEKPDLLILDEPTNHMDMEMIAYLERLIKGFTGAVAFISHDRFLLQNAATRIFEMKQGMLKVYDMGYDAYRETARREREIQQRHYEDFKAEEARQLEIIRRYRSYATEKNYRKAKSREKMLERMKAETPPPVDPKIRFHFGPISHTGQDILRAENLSKSYGDHVLFDRLCFEVKRGDRLAIVGPNGCGKSTLLRALCAETDVGGEYLWGAGVKVGFFRQELTVIDEENTLIDEISDAFPKLGIHVIRSLLGAFLFRGEEAFREVGSLSGGERARISLLKLILGGANVLLLDEPTNHLDLTSKEVLEDALSAFGGTLILVSHDRFFLQKMATRVLDLGEGQRMFEGDFSYYLEKKAPVSAAEEEQISKTERQKQGKKLRREIRDEQAKRRQIEAVEREIESLEEQIKTCDQTLADPDFYAEDDGKRAAETSIRRDALARQLDAAMETWEALQTS